MAFNITIGQPSTAYTITPSDNTVVSYSGVYVGSTGNVAVIPLHEGPTGTVVTFVACPVGFKIPLMVCKVMANGTTASNLVGFGTV